MFWSAVWGGILMLLHWQVWVAAIAYGLGVLLFMILIGGAMGEEDEFGGARQTAGCLAYAILGPVVQGVLLALALGWLFPLMIGGESAVSLGLLVENFGQVIRVGLVAMMIGFVIGFIPILGAIVSDVPGLLTFVMGVVVFRLYALPAVNEVLTEAGVTGSVYPGFWASIGFFLIAAILVLALMGASILGLGALSSRYDTGKWAGLTGSMVGIVGGWIPVFMYAAYTALSVRDAIY